MMKEDLAKRGVEAIESVHGLKYKLGNSAKVLCKYSLVTALYCSTATKVKNSTLP